MDAEGNTLISWTSDKPFGHVVISHPDLVVGGTYTLTAGTHTEEITLDSLVYGPSGGGISGGMDGVRPSRDSGAGNGTAPDMPGPPSGGGPSGDLPERPSGEDLSGVLEGEPPQGERDGSHEAIDASSPGETQASES